MARRLAEAGHVVTAWTRSGQVPAEAGARVRFAETAEQAVSDAAFIIAMLASPKALDDVLGDRAVTDAIGPGAVFADMGTSGAEAAVRHSAIVTSRGGRYLDAPVSGGVVGAEQGTLTIFVGGDAETFRRAEPVFAALGTAHHLGPTGSGQIAKLANQIIVAVNIAGLAEALRFAERAGLDGSTLLPALEGGFADSKVLRTHGPRMARRDFSAGGAIRLHLKDLNLVIDENPERTSDLCHTRKAREVFARLAAAGHEAADHSGYILDYE